jgi:hypothetical protein
MINILSTMPKECVSWRTWCAWSWQWSQRCPESLQKKSTINAQYPQKLCMKYNKYFKHNPNAFFQLVRVVIIIYKKYISVIQNISSKTLEQCNDYFCINKCLVQQLHCLLIVLRCAFDTKILKTINYENHCILKQTWPKFENMIIFTHFIHFSYLGTKFRNFAVNLGRIRQIRSNVIKCCCVGFTLLKFLRSFLGDCLCSFKVWHQ